MKFNVSENRLFSLCKVGITLQACVLEKLKLRGAKHLAQFSVVFFFSVCSQKVCNSVTMLSFMIIYLNEIGMLINVRLV